MKRDRAVWSLVLMVALIVGVDVMIVRAVTVQLSHSLQEVLK